LSSAKGTVTPCSGEWPPSDRRDGLTELAVPVLSDAAVRGPKNPAKLLHQTTHGNQKKKQKKRGRKKQKKEEEKEERKQPNCHKQTKPQ
jgi:hypothetical protein